MPQTNGTGILTTLLENLRGGGFNSSLTLQSFNFAGQKVVAFENGVVYTVNADGVARATVIGNIQSIDF